jgi:predicted ferric reductase
MRGSNRYIGFPAIRFDVVLIVLFLVGNAICIYVNDVPSLVERSALLCAINLVPLALGERMNPLASISRVRLGASASMHEWLGSVVIAEGLVHTAAAMSSQHINIHNTSGVSKLVVSHPCFLKIKELTLLKAAAVGVVLLFSSIAYVRRRFYEIFQKLHLILTAILIAAIYLHSTSKNLFKAPILYLFAAICLQVSIAILRFGQILYRNIKHRTPLNRATVRTITYKTKRRDIPVSDAVHVHIRLSRPWQHRAGQYVYLSIPGVSHTSFVQSHPFFVPWWYRDAKGDFIVLIVEKRKGFTQDLFHNATNDLDQYNKMRAVIEGPYGKELDLKSYGTVLLFATGIGIAGQLPYITQLLDGYYNFGEKNRKIALFWELDSESKCSNSHQGAY